MKHRADGIWRCFPIAYRLCDNEQERASTGAWGLGNPRKASGSSSEPGCPTEEQGFSGRSLNLADLRPYPGPKPPQTMPGLLAFWGTRTRHSVCPFVSKRPGRKCQLDSQGSYFKSFRNNRASGRGAECSHLLISLQSCRSIVSEVRV